MNKKYWCNFYKTHKISSPSSFVLFSAKYLPSHSKIIELGCGNGRDSYYLAKIGHRVTGVDYAMAPKRAKRVIFKKCNMKAVLSRLKKYQVVYSRFFIHAIALEEIHVLLSTLGTLKKGSLFVTEFRVKGDKPIIYKDHKRTFIEGQTVIEYLRLYNFDIMYYRTGRDMALMNNENPFVVRIIAKKR